VIRNHFLGVLILVFILVGSACIKRVTVPETLVANPPVAVEELVGQVNQLSQTKTLSAQGGIKVTNYFTGKENQADELPGGNQLLRLKQPEKILMQVKAPIISKQITDMATDGKKFQLAIYYPNNKRQFIYGTSLKQIKRVDVKELKDPRLKEAGGLVNMRPQHITDAFLVKPLDSGVNVFREEVLQEEADTRPGKRGKRVYRSYYVLYVIGDKATSDSGMAELKRKFWFDRTAPGNPLARQQVFENDGDLVSDITYSGWVKVPDSNALCPLRVIVDRRADGYKLELTIEKDSVEANIDIPDKAFELENTEKLKETNLDESRKPQVAN
jgi:hypothetical protein